MNSTVINSGAPGASSMHIPRDAGPRRAAAFVRAGELILENSKDRMRSTKKINDLRRICAANDAPWQELWNRMTLNLRTTVKEPPGTVSTETSVEVAKKPKREARKKLSREAKMILLREINDDPPRRVRTRTRRQQKEKSVIELQSERSQNMLETAHEVVPEPIQKAHEDVREEIQHIHDIQELSQVNEEFEQRATDRKTTDFAPPAAEDDPSQHVGKYFWSELHDSWSKKADIWNAGDIEHPSRKNPLDIFKNSRWLGDLADFSWLKPGTPETHRYRQDSKRQHHDNQFSQSTLSEKLLTHPWLYASVVLTAIATMVAMETMGYRHMVSIYTTLGTFLFLASAVATYDRLRPEPDFIVGEFDASIRYVIGLSVFVAFMVGLQLIGPEESGPIWQKVLEFIAIAAALVTFYISLQKADGQLRIDMNA